MNVLIVTAHPASHGYTHKIAETYAEGRIAKGHTVEMVDLYSPEYELPMFRFENIKERPINKIQKKFHEQILWAHEIVVVHPIWWGVPPSAMKNWVEQTFWPGVAYKYTPDGKVNKLLTGKTAKIFATAGGPGWAHYFFFMPLYSFWHLCTFGFCGVDVVDVKVCGYLDKYRGERADKRIEGFLKKIKRSARS